LYEDYKPNRRFWKLVLIVRKLSLAMIGILIQSNSALQASLALAVMFASYIAQSRAQPFVRIDGLDQQLLSALQHVGGPSAAPARRDRRGRHNNSGEDTMPAHTGGADNTWWLRWWHQLSPRRLVSVTVDYNSLESAFLVTSVREYACISFR
jgi:hypothetical protein